MRSGWIGVDLDGTLSEWGPGSSLEEIGPPIPLMVKRVARWIHEGKSVRIMTARVATVDYSSIELVDGQRRMIEEWCLKHIGNVLPITATKDYTMMELWDDRCVQIETNTGRRLDGREE